MWPPSDCHPLPHRCAACSCLTPGSHQERLAGTSNEGKKAAKQLQNSGTLEE